jgi:hypothetical protein
VTVLRLRAEALAWRDVGGELVAVDTRTSLYLGGNASGLLLWEALSAGATEDELADALVARYGIDRARAAADVARFLEELRRRELLEG